ncbi:MAG TPA: hypothetical protein VE714_07220 [Gemmatimonadales bacterium]|jgi:hypothetical protein|nr:hypothetical protein [Gemmatimonadales bacterium]
MSVVILPESDLGKELAKWDTPRSQGGMRPDGYEPYPKMLYKAHTRDNGKVQCMEPVPVPSQFLTMEAYQHALAVHETFTRSCQLIVRSEAEHARATREGWRDSPTEAVAHVEALAREIADAAAEANFHAARMSDKAQREFKEANEATHEHVTDVTPRSKKALREQGQ